MYMYISHRVKCSEFFLSLTSFDCSGSGSETPPAWSEDVAPVGSARGGCAASQHCRGQWHLHLSQPSPHLSGWSGTLERPTQSPGHDERGGRYKRGDGDEKMEEVGKGVLVTDAEVTSQAN